MKTTSRSQAVLSLALAGTLAAVLITAACSSHSAPTVSATQGGEPSLRPVALRTVSTGPAPVAEASQSVAIAKSGPPQFIAYRSRDYGIGFQYPWQYAFLNARTLSGGDPSLRPTSDGYEDQVVLAGVEIPQGFYPDTDFERGYLLLSLNQNLGEEECQALVVPNHEKSADAKGGANHQGAGESNGVAASTRTINGVPFHWSESETGGNGSAVKQRRYTAFANGTCYELEMVVNTRNEDGTAHEIDPDRVLRRLESVLDTVKIRQGTQAAPAGTEASTAAIVEVTQQ